MNRIKFDKAERASAKTKKKEWDEIMQNYEKNAKEAKNNIQVLREAKDAYTKKNDFSLEVNTAIILEAFWISELWELNTMGP